MNQLMFFNPMQTFRQGLSDTVALGGQMQTQGNVNKLNQLLPQVGAGVIDGDRQGINALLGAGPQGLEAVNRLRGIGQTDTQLAQGDRRLGQGDRAMDLEAQSLRQRAAEAARAAAAEGRAAEVEQEARALQGLLSQFEVARRGGNEGAFIMQNADAFSQLGIDPREAMEDPDTWFAGALSLHDGLLEGVQGAADMVMPMQEMPDPTTAQRNYEFLLTQGIPEPEARERAFSGGVTNNINTGDQIDPRPLVGTPPVGVQRRWDEASGGWIDEPIPGSDAERNAAAVESAERRSAGDDRAATDIIVREARRALDGAANRTFGGRTGAILGAAFPSTDNAALIRGVDALRGIATVEALMAAKETSATGASGFGALSQNEALYLQAQVGALDPQSPTIEDDLLVATRRILQFVHGEEEGARQFQEQFEDLGSRGSGFEAMPEAAPSESRSAMPDFSTMSPADADRWIKGGGDLRSLSDEQFQALQRAMVD